jgi:thioester reductase-like protein
VNKILITGGTGVVGSASIPLFLRRTKAQIVLLIRAHNADHLVTRKRELFKFLGNDIDPREAESRLQFLAGDVTQNHLGLTATQFGDLAQGLDHIVHSAANVKLDISMDESLRQSVSAAENILSLQRQASNCKLEYLSTVGVNGRRQAPLTEERISHHDGFFNTYEAGKAKAEQIIYQAQSDGLRITIHRPSMVVGHSQNGKIIHFQVFYFLLRLLSGALTRGVLPYLRPVKIDTVPSNLVADALFAAANNSESTGRIFHLSTGPESSLTIYELQSLIREVLIEYDLPCPRLRTVSPRVFRALGWASQLPVWNQKWKTRLRLLPQFMDYASQDQTFLSQNSQEFLKMQGVNWPLPRTYLKTVIEYYVRQMVPLKKVGVKSPGSADQAHAG